MGKSRAKPRTFDEIIDDEADAIGGPFTPEFIENEQQKRFQREQRESRRKKEMDRKKLIEAKRFRENAEW